MCDCQYRLHFTDEEIGTERVSVTKGHRAMSGEAGWTLTVWLHHPNPQTDFGLGPALFILGISTEETPLQSKGCS